MSGRDFTWKIDYSNKAKRSALKLPKKVKLQIDLLVKEIEVAGPLRRNWSHFGPLKKGDKIPDDAYHCHIQGGRPTYVVCWQIEDKILKRVEIFYVGTHENAPY